jgi:hypothetical protein
MAHGVLPSKALATSESSRSPFPESTLANVDVVSLLPLKELVATLNPDHPLRVLLQVEPDEMPKAEFACKVVGWFRLLWRPAST